MNNKRKSLLKLRSYQVEKVFLFLYGNSEYTEVIHLLCRDSLPGSFLDLEHFTRVVLTIKERVCVAHEILNSQCEAGPRGMCNGVRIKVVHRSATTIRA
jgi:diacylglycerol kinase